MARTRKIPALSNHAVPEPGATAGTTSPAPASKIAQVIAMLERAGGATLTELVEMTGWLPHTTRAALTGLRKKGHVIGKESRDRVTVYSLAKAA